MADVRINALSTTATSAASDDYLALDGSANGTRKILATNIAQNVTDVTFGSGGPSAKSSIAARAARQGLVFDGTAGATVANVPAFGTSDFTVDCSTSFASASGDYIYLGGASNSFTLIQTGGQIGIAKTGGAITYFSYTPTASKFVRLTVTRSGTTWKLYANGVLQDTQTTSLLDFTVASTTIGQSGSNTYLFNGFLSTLIYNRALSAAEVVSLYESGVPSGADYNSASNTLLNTSTALNAYSTAFTTFTGASATGFTASDATASKSPRVIFPLSGTLVAGRRYRAKFTATLTAMSSVNLWQSDSSYAGLANLGAVSSGSNEFTFTATSSVNAMMLLCTTDGSVGTHSVVISGLSVDTPGLLLAPDAAQAGGGLTWYDTSGNAANITLPASGVTWNVPSSLKTASGWTFTGGVNAGFINASGDSVINSTAAKTSQDTPLTIGTATGGLNDFQLVLFRSATGAGAYYSLQSVEQGVGYKSLVLNKDGGNVLIGTTTDGGQKLQVAGTAAITGAVSIGNTVTTGVAVASTHKVQISIGGTTYYLLASNV